MKNSEIYREVALVTMHKDELQLYVNGEFVGGNAFDMTDEELLLQSKTLAKEQGVEVKFIDYLIPNLKDSEKESECETLKDKGIINRSPNKAAVEAVAKMIVLIEEFNVEFKRLDTVVSPFISSIEELLKQLDDEEDAQRLAFYMVGGETIEVFENIFNGLVYDDFDLLWFALEKLFKADHQEMSFLEIKSKLKIRLKNLRPGIEVLSPV